MNTADTPLAHPPAESGRDAIHDWLAASLNKPSNAYRQWSESTLAGLALGRQFSAVRLADELVYAPATSGGPAAASAILRPLGGPVIHAPHSRAFYALVPSSPPIQDLGPYAAHLGLGCYLGVPRLSDNRPDRLASYWVIPPSAPGALCDPDRVIGLIEARSAALDEGGESSSTP